MKAFTTVTGRIGPLDLADVDTDQLIPKQFLTSIERTGYGTYLFYAWGPAGVFVTDRPDYRGARSLWSRPDFTSGAPRYPGPVQPMSAHPCDR